MYIEKLINFKKTGSKRASLPKVLYLLISILLALFIGYSITYPSKYIIVAFAAIILVVLEAELRTDYFLAIVVFLLPFPIYLAFGNRDFGTINTFFIFLVFIIWVLKAVVKRQTIRVRTPIDIPIVLMITIYFVSLYNTAAPALESAFRNLTVFFSCILLFYLTVSLVRNEKILTILIDLVTVGCFIEAAIVIWEGIFPFRVEFLQIFAPRTQTMGPAVFGELVRARGTFGTYEIIAEYLSLNILIQIFMVINPETKFNRKIFYRIAMIFSIAGLFVTGTRGAFISLIIGFVYTIFYLRKILKKRVFLAGIIGASLLLPIYSLIVKYTQAMPLFIRLQQTYFVKLVPDTRLYVWSQIIPGIKEHILIGHGPYRIGKLGAFTDPHSLYLHLLFSVGIFGLLAFLAIMIKLFKYSTMLLRENLSTSNNLCYLVVVLQGILVVFMIDEIKISYLRLSCYQQFIWFLFGLLIASSNLLKNNLRIHRGTTNEFHKRN